MAPSNSSYIIVGAGVFGTSTALHIITSQPSASVYLVDRTPFPCPYAASHDINKIIRADYGDIFYTRLGLEAHKQWCKNPLYKPYYNEAGLLQAADRDWCERAIQNYNDLGVNHSARILARQEVQGKFSGLLEDTDWTGVDAILWNPQSGVAEARDALTATIQAAIDRGVTYIEGTVSKLQLDDSRKCVGIRSEEGRDLKADHVILCTGAQTARLLADSAPQWKELQADGRLVAAGVIEAAVKLTTTQEQQFKTAAAFAHESELTLGFSHLFSESIMVMLTIFLCRRNHAPYQSWLAQVLSRCQLHS